MKVKDFFPLITNPKVLKHIEKFVKMSSSNHEKMLKTMQDMYKINPKKFEEMMGGK